MSQTTAARILETVSALSSFRADCTGRLRRPFVPAGILHKRARKSFKVGDLKRARQIMIDTLQVLRSIESAGRKGNES